MGRDVVLFDLDGTLLDTAELILSSWRHVRDTFALHAGDDAFRRSVGRPLVEIFDQFARDGAERDRFVEAYLAHNLAAHDAMVKPFPGIRELLVELRARRARIGVVTSKRRRTAQRGLDVAGLVVDALVGPEDVARPKPDPEPVRLALRLLQASPASAVFVGDSPHDVLAGKAAGVRTVAVRWGMFAAVELAAAEPDAWIERPDELLPLLGEG